MKNIFLTVFLFITSFFIAQKTFIHCGSLIDVVSIKTLFNKTTIVENNIIIEVKDGLATPGANDILINLTTKTVMPGLMDMHVPLQT